jgi:hypothetical protein
MGKTETGEMTQVAVMIPMAVTQVVLVKAATIAVRLVVMMVVTMVAARVMATVLTTAETPTLMARHSSDEMFSSASLRNLLIRDDLHYLPAQSERPSHREVTANQIGGLVCVMKTRTKRF